MKTLCLGAKAIPIGNPVVDGLTANGKMRAESVIEGLLAELWQSMRLAGMRMVKECSQDCMRKIAYPGDLKVML